MPRTAHERRRAQSLLAAALRWITGYEAWAVATLGLEYRRQCLADWPHKVRRPEEMAGEVARLAAECEAVARWRS